MREGLREAVGRRLEQGSGWIPAAAAVWDALARVERPVRLPRGLPVVGVGGAVLGGAGKTPVAIALAGELARRGARVVVVGHAYGATPRQPRVVGASDAVAEVGDDALFAARALGDEGAVVVAPTRQRAIDCAAALAPDVIVVDGLLQATPQRVTDSILVLDGAAPWGGGACPPVGDLRASPARLLAAADWVALVTPTGRAPNATPPGVVVPSSLAGARDRGGAHHRLLSLRPSRVGLLLTVARPGRIAAALAEAGLVPVSCICLADHAADYRRAVARSRTVVDVWLTTGRCATKLPAAIGGAPVLALDHVLDVGRLTDVLRATTLCMQKTVVGSRPC